MNISQQAQALLRGDGSKAKLMRGGIGSFGVRGAYIALESGTAIILAHALGAHGYGIYAFAFALMRILALPAQAGLPTLVVREVAAYEELGYWGRLRGLLVRVNQAALSFAVLLGVCALVVAWVVYRDSEGFYTFVWAVVLLPLAALGNIRGAALRGLHKVVQGQLPENVLRPGMFLGLLCAATVFVPKGTLGPASAMALHALAGLGAFLVGAYLLIKYLPRGVITATSEYDTKRWLGTVIPLSVISSLQILNGQFAIIALGVFSDSADVGVFRAILQLGMFVAFSLTAVNMAVAPHISKLYIRGDRVKLQEIARWGSRVIFLVSVVSGAAVAFLAPEVLRYGFGADFERGSTALIIVCVGQVLSAATGASLIFLNMTGNEKAASRSVALGTAANVLLNVALVPKFSLVGAAIASSVGLLILNMSLARHVRARLNINPFVS